MCDHCVIESVKERMLSRRELFKAGAAVATAATITAAAAATPALAAGHSKVEDLTHTYDEKFPTYFGAPGVKIEQKFSWDENKFNLFELTVNEHTGTHMDAPLHFSENGQSVDEIPVSNLVVPLCVVDIADKANENPDAQITPEDIKDWISKNGPIPDNACVAMHSGWEAKIAEGKYRNVGEDGKTMHFPGFHVEAAKMLIEETKAVGIAVDTLSLDHGPSADFATHYAWLPSNRWGLENVANLGNLPAAGATLVVGAPKHRGGSGGPCRIFAMV